MSFREKLVEELKAVGVVAAYFGCWIAAILWLKKIVLAEYDIAFGDFSDAVIGALVLAKVVIVLEHVPLGRWIRRRPAWVDVIVRTLLYAAGVFVVLVLEKSFEARHEYGSFSTSLANVFQQADIHHVWANTVCLGGALLSYNVLSVIRKHLGHGYLRGLLLLPLPDEPESG